MYRVSIINDGVERIIHDPTPASPDKILLGNIVQGINSIDSFSFRITSQNGGFVYLYPYKTLIKVFNTKKHRIEFYGRILTQSDVMEISGHLYKDIVCESRLAYLCDSVQPYVDLENYTVNGFLSLLLENHNTQVDGYKRINLGTVTVTDPNDNIYRSLNYQTTWQAIKEKLIAPLGGEMQIRETEGLLYLDYLKEIGSTKATAIALAKNMKSISRDVDPTEFATRLIPLGEKLKDEDGQETEERLTIASVNNGKIYLDDFQAQAEFGGIITKTEVWDDITLPANLKAAGLQWLIDNNKLQVSHAIEALDLSLIGIDVDDYTIGNSHPVKNSLLDIDTVVRIVKKTVDVVDPAESKIEFGDRGVLISDWHLKKRKDIDESIQQIENNVNNIKINDLPAIRQEIITQTTAVLQDAEQIILQALENYVSTGNFEEYQETVTTQFSVMAGEILMNFNTIIETNNYAETNFQEISKYIRFADGNIILGESGNELTLTIQNDRISFSQNGVEVAYFSDNRLYVKDGEFIDTLKIGNFAFVPRSNGNLSLKKVGG